MNNRTPEHRKKENDLGQSGNMMETSDGEETAVPGTTQKYIEEQICSDDKMGSNSENNE